MNIHKIKELGRVAFEVEKADYFLQLNDDTKILTPVSTFYLRFVPSGYCSLFLIIHRDKGTKRIFAIVKRTLIREATNFNSRRDEP